MGRVLQAGGDSTRTHYGTVKSPDWPFPNDEITMLPFPFLGGICLGFRGTPDHPKFIIKDEWDGRATLYWNGTRFTPDSREALVFDNFVTARTVAWRLKSDYVWAWYNDFFGKGTN